MTEKKQITVTADRLQVLAPAKINLSLLVAGKRPDGFHELETIMAKVDLYDELLIQRGDKEGIEVTCDGPYWAPEGEENLIYKACQLFLKETAINADIKINLTKNIPAGSGLGSASSDAAATLIGLEQFLNTPIGTEKLQHMAAELGSDVAFFLGGPLAFCTGRGEKIKNFSKIFDFSAVLILPDISISTKTVYDSYEHYDDVYRRLSSEINAHIEKNRIDLVALMCANMLQAGSLRLYKELADLKKLIESSGFGPLCLSGSGSSLFYFLGNDDEKKALAYQWELEEKIGCKSIVVRNNRW